MSAFRKRSFADQRTPADRNVDVPPLATLACGDTTECVLFPCYGADPHQNRIRNRLLRLHLRLLRTRQPARRGHRQRLLPRLRERPCRAERRRWLAQPRARERRCQLRSWEQVRPNALPSRPSRPPALTSYLNTNAVLLPNPSVRLPSIKRIASAAPSTSHALGPANA